MARKRTGIVSEDLQRLEELERRYHGKSQELRIRVLKLFKQDPSRTADEVSALIGCSERSVRRWWSTYVKEGLDALLELNVAEEGKRSGVDGSVLEILGRMIMQKEFGDLHEVRDWLRREFGSHYSLSEVHYIICVRLGIIPHWRGSRSQRGVPFERAAVTGSSHLLPCDFLNFLNALPLTDDTNEWNDAFRAALLRLLNDVDHIAVNINQTCNLTSPESYRPNMVLRQHNGLLAKRQKRVVLTALDEEGRPSERVLEEFRLQGRPLHDFHDPVSFDYYYEGYAYLGSIFLFRSRGASPISEETLTMINALEPFIIYALSNHVMWYQQSKPAEQVFQEGLRRLKEEAELSAQEQRVVIYHLLGYSYEEMADLLTISTKTVKKHINTIHHKTRTHRQRELFARYFSPRILFAATDDGE